METGTMQIKILKIRPIASMVLLIIVTLFFQPSPVGGAPIVNTDKDIYNSGEMIKVNFSSSPGNAGDWICIVPAGSPDTEGGDYKYMPRGLSQGVLTFDARSPGKYEVRAYYNYSRNGYVVSARYGFSVGVSVPAVESKIASPAKPLAGAEKTTTMEKSEGKAISRGASRYNVSVFHFTPLNMDASSYGITATNTLINALKTEPSFVMLDRKDLETFLSIHDLQQNDQMENVVNIGTRMGLNFVIAGTIEKRGSLIVTNCKVINIDQKKITFTKHSVSMGEANLVSDFRKLSDSIVEAILRSVS
jgi:TolB-like protein